MRSPSPGWLNDVRSYLPPVGIGAVMRAGGIAKVAASKSSKFSKGDYVDTMTGWQEWTVVREKDAHKLVCVQIRQLWLLTS